MRYEFIQNNKTGVRQVGHTVFIALLEALEDYSIDDRGDVGSWVREAALAALERWTLRLCLVSEKETTTPTQPVEVTDSTGINELPSQQQPLWTPELSQVSNSFCFFFFVVVGALTDLFDIEIDG